MLGAGTRARIAVAVAQTNNCGYCLSVHSHLGMEAVRAAGYANAQIAEIAALVAENVFANYLSVRAFISFQSAGINPVENLR